VQLNLNRPRDKPPCLTVGRFDSTDVQVDDAAAWLGAPRPIGGCCRAGLSHDDLSVAARGCPGSFDLRVEKSSIAVGVQLQLSIQPGLQNVGAEGCPVDLSYHLFIITIVYY